MIFHMAGEMNAIKIYACENIFAFTILELNSVQFMLIVELSKIRKSNQMFIYVKMSDKANTFFFSSNFLELDKFIRQSDEIAHKSNTKFVTKEMVLFRFH